MLRRWLKDLEEADGAAEIAGWLWGVTVRIYCWSDLGSMDGYMNKGKEHMVGTFQGLLGLAESARANPVVPRSGPFE